MGIDHFGHLEGCAHHDSWSEKDEEEYWIRYWESVRAPGPGGSGGSNDRRNYSYSQLDEDAAKKREEVREWMRNRNK